MSSVARNVIPTKLTPFLLSDIDVALKLTYGGFQKTPQQILPVISDLLHRAAFMKGKCLPDIPVPAIRGVTLPDFGSYKIDITADYDDAIDGMEKMGELMSELASERWASMNGHRKKRARRLILFLKFFLQKHKCYGTACNGLTGIAVSSMVVAYFKVNLLLRIATLIVHQADSILVARDDGSGKTSVGRKGSRRLSRLLRITTEDEEVRGIAARKAP